MSRFALYRKDNWITFNEHEIVDDLPASLRADVIMCIHHNTIEQIAWFKNKDPTFIADVVVNLKPRLFRVSVVWNFSRTPLKAYILPKGRSPSVSNNIVWGPCPCSGQSHIPTLIRPLYSSANSALLRLSRPMYVPLLPSVFDRYRPITTFMPSLGTIFSERELSRKNFFSSPAEW